MRDPTVKTRRVRRHPVPGKGTEKEQPEAQTEKPHAPPVLSAGYTTGTKIDVVPACMEFTVKWR